MTQNGKAFLICTSVVAAMAAFGLVASRVLTGGSAQAFQPAPAAKPAPAEASADPARRGAYLWSVLGCMDCHTPRDEKGQPIAAMMMAGHPEKAPLPDWDPSMLQKSIVMTADPTFTAFAGPWGTSIAPNLTPDKETGIGTMTADALIQSFKTGKHWRTGADIMPPMSISSYANLTEDDMRAIHAFLMKLPPIHNKVPPSRPASPPPQGKGG